MQGKRLQSKVIPTGGPVDSDESPETGKRKGKPATERPPLQDADIALKLNQDEKGRRRRLQDPLPLEVPSETANLISGHQSAINVEPFPHGTVARDPALSNPTYVPKSGYYFQHDDRSPPMGRGNKRKSYDRAGTKWVDYRAKGWSGEWSRDTGTEPKRREERTPGRLQDGRQSNPDGVWRHDKFFDTENELQDRKRHVAGEEGNDDKSSGVDVKLSDVNAYGSEMPSAQKIAKIENQNVNSNQKVERRFSDGYGGRGDRLDGRNDVERGRWMDADAQNDRSQTRFSSTRPIRGRERWGKRFDGNEMGARNNRVSVERWKHDMFDEANRSPTPENEEDSIAKIEALLAA